MKKTKAKSLDYRDACVREEVLDRQRRTMWTPEQIASLAKHFRLKPGMKLLDAGCGHGFSLRTFGPYCLPGGKLVGCDREKVLLDGAQRLAEEEGLGKAAQFDIGNIYQLPYDSDAFDFSIAQVVLCHLSEPERALDELIRVTRPGGCVAVIDNSHPIGISMIWNNVSKPTIPQLLFRCEANLRMRRGRRRLGLGDFAVGCEMPGWMEQRGLKDVDVRQNERVNWIAPPYSSPAQQAELMLLRERIASPWWRRVNQALDIRAWYRAGGVDETMLKRIMRMTRRDMAKVREAQAADTLAHSIGSWLWCVWGFK